MFPDPQITIKVKSVKSSYYFLSFKHVPFSFLEFYCIGIPSSKILPDASITSCLPSPILTIDQMMRSALILSVYVSNSKFARIMF